MRIHKKIYGYVILYIRVVCLEDEDIYIRAHSDFSRPLTRRRLTSIRRAHEKHCREMGYDVRYSEFITEQEYAENAGEALRGGKGDDTNVAENGGGKRAPVDAGAAEVNDCSNGLHRNNYDRMGGNIHHSNCSYREG